MSRPMVFTAVARSSRPITTIDPVLVERLHLSVDSMGGDGGPATVIPAVMRYLSENPDISVTLHGLERELLEYLPDNNPSGLDRCKVRYSAQVVNDDDLPSAVVRHKTDSSMWHAVKMVADGGADACISGGNTGALVAIGCRLLGNEKNVDRPAICTALPTATGRCYLLDVGANVDCAPQQLHTLARIASEYVRGLENLASPSVALLNIGKESTKGNRVVKRCSELLNHDDTLNYAGFIEADRLFNSDVNIVVCDGFVGNVALKASEGMAKLIISKLSSLKGEISESLINTLRQEYDPGAHNGAVLLGLKGTVIKSHGSSDIAGFCCALKKATQTVVARKSGIC
jgi:phosphate acyltransferase